MARKQIKVSKRMVFTWFMLGGLIFLFAPQRLTNNFQFAFAHLFRWPLTLGRTVSLSSRVQQNGAEAYGRKESQYQNHITNLEQQLEEANSKIEKLAGLRERHPMEGAKLMLADIITASIKGPRNELIINRGEKDGIAKGQFVLGDNSIIGIVSEVSPGQAKVRLITDSESQIAVKIAQIDVNSVMQGKGNGLASVGMLKMKYDIKSGDKVHVLKKPGFLDCPMIAGTVVQHKRSDENPLLWSIIIKPACDIENLASVTVIIMNPQK
jgi:rod shape-determining protein MreC